MAKQNKVTHELKYKNKSIINKDSSQDAKATFSNSDNWKNYARYIGRNRFFRNYLFHTYNERCQFCGKKLNPDTFVLHHKTYLHECITDDRITVAHPTAKRPKRNRKIPDCLSCSSITPEAFEECASRIVPVCCVCNLIIEKIYLKQHPEKKTPKKLSL